MSLQRKNPLPPGKYWIDTFGTNRATVAAYLQKAVKDGSVAVRSTQSFDTDPPRDWFLFEVLAAKPGEPALPPVAWPAVKWGFPTIAAPGVTQSDDTAQKPVVPDTVSQLADAAQSVSENPGAYVAIAVGGLLGLGLLLYLVRR